MKLQELKAKIKELQALDVAFDTMAISIEDFRLIREELNTDPEISMVITSLVIFNVNVSPNAAIKDGKYFTY